MASLLVVEDDDDTTNLMHRWLSQAGHEVTSVTDGEAALALVGDGAVYDLVLLDVNLPGIDGFEVARRLGMPALERVLICSVSEHEDAPEDLRGVKWVIKPFGRADFLAAIDEALDGADA